MQEAVIIKALTELNLNASLIMFRDGTNVSLLEKTFCRQASVILRVGAIPNSYLQRDLILLPGQSRLTDSAVCCQRIFTWCYISGVVSCPEAIQLCHDRLAPGKC